MLTVQGSQVRREILSALVEGGGCPHITSFAQLGVVALEQVQDWVDGHFPALEHMLIKWADLGDFASIIGTGGARALHKLHLTTYEAPNPAPEVLQEAVSRFFEAEGVRTVTELTIELPDGAGGAVTERVLRAMQQGFLSALKSLTVHLMSAQDGMRALADGIVGGAMRRLEELHVLGRFLQVPHYTEDLCRGLGGGLLDRLRTLVLDTFLTHEDVD